jgi:hypothetical protein
LEKMATSMFSISRQEEKAALDAVLQSELFKKSASQSQFLSYICKKFFAGEAAQIKEYNVAVEALGRPADFYPKQNPIVRVEGFRLRKRLKKFYETQGQNQAVQITVPPGQYVPLFIHNQDGAAPRTEDENTHFFSLPFRSELKSGLESVGHAVLFPPEEEEDLFGDFTREYAGIPQPSDKKRWLFICSVLGIAVIVSVFLLSLR